MIGAEHPGSIRVASWKEVLPEYIDIKSGEEMPLLRDELWVVYAISEDVDVNLKRIHSSKVLRTMVDAIMEINSEIRGLTYREFFEKANREDKDEIAVDMEEMEGRL